MLVFELLLVYGWEMFWWFVGGFVSSSVGVCRGCDSANFGLFFDEANCGQSCEEYSTVMLIRLYSLSVCYVHRSRLW